MELHDRLIWRGGLYIGEGEEILWLIEVTPVKISYNLSALLLSLRSLISLLLSSL